MSCFAVRLAYVRFVMGVCQLAAAAVGGIWGLDGVDDSALWAMMAGGACCIFTAHIIIHGPA